MTVVTHRRRVRLLVISGTAGIVAAVVAVGVLALQPQPGSVIGGGSAGVVVDAFPAGSTVTYGLQTIGNGDPERAIELISIEPRIGTPSLDVRGPAMLAGPDRVDVLGAGMFDVLPGWPIAGLELSAVSGTTVAAGIETAYEVVVPVTVPTV